MITQLPLVSLENASGPVSRVEVYVFDWHHIPEPGKSWFLNTVVAEAGAWRDGTYPYHINSVYWGGFDGAGEDYQAPEGYCALNDYLTSHVASDPEFEGPQVLIQVYR